MNKQVADPGRCIAELTNTIETDSDPRVLTKALINRAHEFNARGQRVESVQDYLRALDLAEVPRDICHIKCMISLALAEAGDKEQAMWWAVSATDSEPASPEGLFTYALNCFASDLYKCAIAGYRAVLAIDPKHSQPRLNLGKSFREQGNLDEALKELTAYVIDHPNDPHGHFEVAWTAYLHPNLHDHIRIATEHYHEALKLHPSDSLRMRIEINLQSLEAS